MENYQPDAEPLDFDDIANQLLEQGAQYSPAHLHGAICGVVAGGGQRDPEYCLAAVMQALDLEMHGELAGNCLQLAWMTVAKLADEDLDFQLFMPDDDDEVELRVRALADWCSAFLLGYAQAMKLPPGGKLDDDASEVLRDMAAIAEAAVDADMEPEEAESHYFEISEYLRIATLNLFMDQLDEGSIDREGEQDPE